MTSPREPEDRAAQKPGQMSEKNVLGGDLKCCCTNPITGFYRDGHCKTGPEDRGVHVVCAEMTEAFLTYTQAQGNDLSSPLPQFQFPGLKPGDRWCLCAARWREALEDGLAPPVVLEACQASALNYVTLEQLKDHAVEDA